MATDNRSLEELVSENETLRLRLEEAEETLQAIRSGEVDALVVSSPGGERVFTLQGAEQPYRVLVETMNEGAAFISTDGMIVYCNRQLSNLLQVPMEKLIGSRLLDHVASQDQALVFDRQAVDRAEITLKTSTGSHLSVLFSCAAVDLAGKQGVSVVVTDISAIKEAEMQIATAAERERTAQSILESEELLRLALDAARLGIYDWDITGNQVIWSQRTQELFGFRPGEFGGRYEDFASRVHPEDLPAVDAEIARSRTEQNRFSCEYRVVWPDGSMHWVVGHGEFSCDSTGRPVHMLGTVEDITERKWMEHALREAEERMVFALQTIHTGGWYLDLVDHTAYRTLEHDRIFGYETLLPKWTYEMFLGHVLPKDRPEVDRLFQKAVATQTDWNLECRIRRVDGQVRWIWAVGGHQRDSDGRIRKMTGIVQDITERKLQQEVLLEAEAQKAASRYVRNLIEASLDPLVTINPEGIITDVNAATEAVTGYARDALIGTEFADCFADPMAARAGYQQAFTTGLVTNYALDICHRDGHLTPVMYNASVYRDETGKVAGVFAAAHDITERKAHETEIIESRNLLMTVINTAPIRVFWKDRDLRYLGCNVAFAKDAGMTQPNDVIGKDDFKMAWADRAELYQTDDRAVLESGIAKLSYDEPLMITGEPSIWVRTSKVPLRNQDGEVLGLLGIYEDITERKQTEEALWRSEKKFRALTEEIPQIVWMTRPDGWNIYFNQQWVDYTGLTLEESYGEAWITPFHPDDRQRAWDAWQNATQTDGVYSLECRLRRADGIYRWWLVRGVSMHDADGKVVNWFGTYTDIQDMKESEERLLNAEKSLKQINETLGQRVREETEKNRQKEHLLIQQSRLAAMGEMIGNIAHQWRQPLNALALVLANIEDAASRQELTPEYRGDMIRSGERLIQRMSSTIDDFRHFFRPQKQPEPFSAAAAIEETLSLVSASFANNHIELRLDMGQDVQLVGFANEFSQVLLNLLSNAKDAILSHRKQDGLVTIRLSSDGSNATVVVADNGGGIPVAVMGRIFEPYFSTKAMGTGIGLYMSKMIVEGSMRGSINAQNVDSGAEFTLTCPLCNETNPPREVVLACS